MSAFASTMYVLGCWFICSLLWHNMAYTITSWQHNNYVASYKYTYRVGILSSNQSFHSFFNRWLGEKLNRDIGYKIMYYNYEKNYPSKIDFIKDYIHWDQKGKKLYQYSIRYVNRYSKYSDSYLLGQGEKELIFQFVWSLCVLVSYTNAY